MTQFIGVDLAWGEGSSARPAKETGLAVVDGHGTVLDAGWARGIDAVAAWIIATARPGATIAVDAPLVVPNASGMRLAERQVGMGYGRWKVAANASNAAVAWQGGVALRSRLEEAGLVYTSGIAPSHPASRVFFECYPYTTPCCAHGPLRSGTGTDSNASRCSARTTNRMPPVGLRRSWHPPVLSSGSGGGRCGRSGRHPPRRPPADRSPRRIRPVDGSAAASPAMMILVLDAALVLTSRMDPAIQSMIDNLPTKTGRSLDDWFGVLAASRLDKHTDLVSHLKRDHGVSHGFANQIALLFRDRGATRTDADLVDAQYAGAKAPLRPLYDSIIGSVESFGPDVVISPKRTGVSLRRHRQFALIEAPSSRRLQIGINLGGEPGTDRLLVAGGMCTHKVNLSSAEEIDAELLAWLRQAYDAG